MKHVPHNVKGKLREIQVRYGSDLRNRKAGRKVSKATLRCAELDRLYRSRYGDELPDDDAGRDDARIMVHHLAQISGDPLPRLTAWLAVWAPWMPTDEAVTLIGAATSRPIRWRADTLGVLLRLTDAERTRLKIKMIRPIDVTMEQLIERGKVRDRERKAAKRRAAGAQPRKQYEAAATGHGKPWIAAGMSRAAWYRKQAAKVVQ
jgi:hypothetical protein